MRKKPWLFGIDAIPPGFLMWIPFLAVILCYQISSMLYLSDNADGRLIPSFTTMGHRIWVLAVERDTLWLDTYASLYRIAIGVVSGSVVGLLVGMNMALFPGMRKLLLSFITTISSIPPMGFVAMVIILAGTDDVSKIILIFLGIVFSIIRSMYLETSQQLPKELLIKARTLGASQLSYVYQIALPIVMPRLIETTRISLGAAWVYLLSSEALAASSGLGYRMFVVIRQMDMSTIYPYLIWIGLLAFTMDQSLRLVLQVFYPWCYERGSVAQLLAGVTKRIGTLLSRRKS